MCACTQAIVISHIVQCIYQLLTLFALQDSIRSHLAWTTGTMAQVGHEILDGDHHVCNRCSIPYGSVCIGDLHCNPNRYMKSCDGKGTDTGCCCIVECILAYLYIWH